MTGPENAKFLPQEVQDRTGLELNPLWQIEVLVRSGTLAPQNQLSALKSLAEYTHSKSPSLSQQMTGKPEDFLIQLAEQEFEQVKVSEVHKAPPGQGKRHASELRRREKWREQGLVRDHGVWRRIDGDPTAAERDEDKAKE
jgi:hypothetical protein